MKEEDRIRLSRLIEQDREGLNKESREEALKGFLHVAEEFFELAGELAFTVTKERRGFDVTLHFKADRVKNFTAIK